MFPMLDLRCCRIDGIRSMEKSGMTPAVKVPRGTPTVASEGLRHAAAIARDAAEFLAGEPVPTREAARYLLAADRLTQALELPQISRHRLLMASPAVLERSGRSRTLIDMIDAEPDDDAARLRLAKLLLRALIWQPETFPYPGD
jgi:hypothetical protein